MFGKKPATNLIPRKTIDNVSIRDIIVDSDKDTSGAINLVKTCIYLSDPVYNLFNKEDIAPFLANNSVLANRYVPTIQDCENFAVRLWGRFDEYSPGFVFGLAWSGNHAFNIFIDSNKQIWILEPQTNEIISLGDAKKNNMYWPLRLVVI